MIYFKRSRIKDAADLKGFTLAELASRISKSNSTVSEWVSGKRKLKDEDISLLCNALECGADYFFTDE